MIEDVTEENFEEVMSRRNGYLVNVWYGRGAKAHSLAHMHGACRSMMQPTDLYPKFYASDEQAAIDYARTRHGENCTICRQCHTTG